MCVLILIYRSECHGNKKTFFFFNFLFINEFKKKVPPTKIILCVFVSAFNNI